MARTVRWTETATEDINEAAAFIARDSPERGRVVPEVGRTDIREIFVKSYRLMYQVTKREVFILAFIHGARDFASLWKHRAGGYQKTDC